MLDFAKLGIQVDSKDARRAVKDLDDLTRAGGRAERSTDELGTATKRTNRDVRDYTGTVDRAGRETKQLGDQADRATAKTRAMGAAARGAAASWAKLGALIGVVASAATFTAATRSIVGFERSMAKVGAITRATDREMAMLRDTAKELGATTEFSASQAAEGLSFLGMAGFSATESIAALPDVLNLATAAEIELGQAADIASNIMGAFRIDATNAAEAIDVLAAISSRANTNIPQLGTAMALVGPVAKAAGQSIEDTAAAIGVLSDDGIQGSRAGTSLRTAISALLNPSNQARAAIRSLGLTFDDVNPATNNMVDVIRRFSEAGIDGAAAVQIFGREGAAGILSLTANTDKLENLATEMRNVQGEAQRMADYMRNQLGGDFDTLRSSVEALFIAMGEAGLTSALRAVVQGATAVVRGLTALVEGVGKATDALKALAVVVVGLTATQLPALVLWLGRTGAAAIAAARSISVLRLAFLAGRTSAILLATTMAALGGPVGILVGAVAAAATGIWLFRDRIFGTKKPTDDLAEAQRLLNEATALYAEDAAPDAAAAALQKARAYEEEAQSALAAAQATLAIEQARLAAFTQRVEEDPRLRRGSGNARRRITESIAEATAAVERAQNALNESQKTSVDILVDMAGKAIDNAEATGQVKQEMEGVKSEAGKVVTELGKIPGSLDGASAQAISLASQLGVAAGEAERLNAALNRDAGLPGAQKPGPRLGFAGVGDPDTGGVVTEPGLGFGTFSDSPLRDGSIRAREAAEEAAKALGGGSGGATGETRKSVEDLRDEVNQLWGSLDEGVAATQRLKAQKELLNEALDRGAISAATYESVMDKVEAAQNRNVTAAENLKNSVADTFTSIVSGAESAKDAVKNLLNQLATLFINNAFQQLFSGVGTGTDSVLGGFFSFLGFNARGTPNWKGGRTVVGEEGPEIVDLPKGSKIYSNDQSQRMVASGEASNEIAQMVAPGRPPEQSVGAGSASGIRANAGAPYQSMRQVEPSRVEPAIPARSASQPAQPMTAPPEFDMSKINFEPVIQLEHYNYIDRDKMIEAYIDSPRGRRKTVSVVNEEGGSR